MDTPFSVIVRKAERLDRRGVVLVGDDGLQDAKNMIGSDVYVECGAYFGGVPLGSHNTTKRVECEKLPDKDLIEKNMKPLQEVESLLPIRNQNRIIEKFIDPAIYAVAKSVMKIFINKTIK